MSTKSISVARAKGDLRLASCAPLKFVKRNFLECELKTADDLIEEYREFSGPRIEREGGDSVARHKLIWLLERLQEEVL